MNNVSFKGFYQVAPIQNKKVNMKLASAMVSTIPEASSMSYMGSNSMTLFIPEDKELQFEQLAQALRAKSLVYIENIGTKIPSLDSLLKSRIRDFNPSEGEEYVALSTDELKKFIDMSGEKTQDKNSNYGLFQIALFDTKINIPEIHVSNPGESLKEPQTSKHKKFGRIQIPNNSKDILYSFLKLGYKEIPVKLSQQSLKNLKKISKETGLNLISRELDVLSLEK